VDDRDHLWIIHMPSSLTDQEIGAAMKPPIADCCYPAPPVLERDADGKVMRSWGGPGAGYTWLNQQHGIYIDHHRFVWMGASNGMHVMKFSQDGQHVLTIGEPGVNKGRNDSTHLGASAIPRGLPSRAQGHERLGIVTYSRSNAIICSEPPSFDDLLRTAQSI